MLNKDMLTVEEFNIDMIGSKLTHIVARYKWKKNNKTIEKNN